MAKIYRISSLIKINELFSQARNPFNFQSSFLSLFYFVTKTLQIPTFKKITDVVFTREKIVFLDQEHKNVTKLSNLLWSI